MPPLRPVLLLALAAVLGACSRSDGTAPLPGPLPSDDATAAAWPNGLTTGTATLRITGYLDRELELSIQSGSGRLDVSPATRPFYSVQWAARDSLDILSIVADEFEGARRTSDDLRIGLSTTDGEHGPDVFFLSRSGECAITIRTLTRSGLSGEIQCRDLSTAEGDPLRASIDLTGTFSAEV